MGKNLKRSLYFVVASYFRLWAMIQLKLWHPTIFVVTGSSGKTTVLHLLESQLGKKARYSHHANSSFGIPFDILGLKRTTLLTSEWISLLLKAPFRALKRPYKESLYVVEVDCDRPGEGEFLATLLKPHYTLWVSLSRTHTVNFDALVRSGVFPTVEDAIAHEFAAIVAHTRFHVFANGDTPVIAAIIQKLAIPNTLITLDQLKSYRPGFTKTSFHTETGVYTLPVLSPMETFYGMMMIVQLFERLSLPVDPAFPSFTLPPGRSSVFEGVKETVLVDSSYNATPDGMHAIVEMFSLLPGKKKWAVIGDMVELGDEEQEEHERLAKLLKHSDIEHLVFVGPRTSKHTYPKVQNDIPSVAFDQPKEALDYIQSQLNGKEIILFKGARFLEGVVEALLLHKKDAAKLARREKAWQQRRNQWGLSL